MPGQSAFDAIMSGRGNAPEALSSTPVLGTLGGSDAYSQIMNAKAFGGVQRSIDEALHHSDNQVLNQVDPFDSLPFSRQSLQTSVDRGLSVVQGRDGSAIPIYDALRATGQGAWGSNVTDAQEEQRQIDALNPNVGNDFQTHISPDWTYSGAFQQGAENVHTLAEEMLKGFYKGVQQTFYGAGPEAPGLTREEAPYAYAAVDSVSGLLGGTLGLGSAAFKIIENPLSTPEVLGETAKGIVTAVNPFEPGIEAPERFGRSINLALIFAAGLEGAGKLRDASLASNLRSLGIDKPTAYGIVRSAREGLSMLDKETGQSTFFNPVKDIVKGDRIKSAVADFADMVEPGVGEQSLLVPNIAQRAIDKINPFIRGEAPGAVETPTQIGTANAVDLPTSTGAVASAGNTQVAAPREILPGLGQQSETGRIMPSPLNDGAPVKNIEDITSKLYEDLTMKANRQGKTGRDAGFYDTEQATTVTRAFNDLSNEPHELGHFLNEQYELVTDWDKPRARSPYDAELDSLWEGRNTDSMTLARKREEGVAEFVRAYVINPDEALAKAPEFYKHFEESVPENVRTALRNAGDDIRRYVGQTASDLVQNQIVDKLDTPNLIQRLQAGMKGVRESVGGRSRDTSVRFEQAGIDRFRHAWTDNLAPLQAAMEYVRRITGDNPLPEHDAVLLANRYRYVDNAVKDALDIGIRDSMGNVVKDANGQPLSLGHILEPLKGEEEFRAMLSYGTSERVVSEAARIRQAALDEATGLREQAKELRDKNDLKGAEKLEQKAQRLIDKSYLDSQSLTNAGAGFYDSASVHAAQMQELAKNPELLGRIQESLRRYRAFSDALMTYAKDRGLISEEHLANLRAKGDTYFDLGRVMDESSDRLGLPREHRTTVQNLRKSGNVLKVITGKFKGSTRLIHSPLVELMVNAKRVIELGERNQVLNAIVDPMRNTEGLSPQQRNLLASVAEKVQVGESGPDTITMLVNGEKEVWKLEPMVAQVLKEANNAGAIEPFMKFLGLSAKVLRWGVTATPEFMVRNLLRDTWERFVKGESGMNPLDTVKNIKTGGEFSSWYSYMGGGIGLMDEPMTRFGYEAMQRRLVKGDSAIGKASTWYRHAREAFERSNRLAEYRSAHAKAYQEFVAQGLPEEQAQYNAHLKAGEASRALMDYARGGTVMRQINRVIPFTNAAVQGITTTFKSAIKNPAKFGASTFVTLGTLTMMEQWYARNIGSTQEEKDRNWREYNELPAYQKDLFFNFNVPGFGFVRIPKPYEIGVFVSMFPRIASGNWDGYFDDHGNVLEGSVLKVFMPLRITDTSVGVFKTVQELNTGYDSFRGSYFVPPDQNKAALALRDQSNASGIGKAIGGITNVDARKIDHLFQGVLGNAGSALTTMTKGNVTGAQAMKLLTGLTTDVASYSATDVNWCLWKAEQAKAGNPFSKEFQAMKQLKQDTKMDPVAKANALSQIRLGMIDHAVQLRKVAEQVEKQPFTDEKSRWSAIQRVMK